MKSFPLSSRFSLFSAGAIGLLGWLFLSAPVRGEEVRPTQPPLKSPPASPNALPAPNVLTAEEIAEGWLLLWDGQTLFGWRGMPAEIWQAADGVLRSKPGQAGMLRSTSEWADFAVQMEFRTEPGTQASLLLRTSPEPKQPSQEGYEVLLTPADQGAWPVGSLMGRKKAGAPPEKSSPGAGSGAGASDTALGWQKLAVTAQGGAICVLLNGREVLRYEDAQPIRRGHLALRIQKGSIAVRNFKLRPLGLQSIFNGKDLSGWKEYPQMASRFTVTPEGWLRVQNGRGQLETTGQYADFTLQLDVFVNGQSLNSGIFFRCIPGETMNGYECQIHNGFLDGDRSKPKDCGTGGIFRRQNARKVVADDFTWFTLTIHAHGPHVATWVNGYPVVDWTDTRPADSNPRKGQRLEAGTLQIQGHDPTTDLMFRNIRVAELPPR